MNQGSAISGASTLSHLTRSTVHQQVGPLGSLALSMGRAGRPPERATGLVLAATGIRSGVNSGHADRGLATFAGRSWDRRAVKTQVAPIVVPSKETEVNYERRGCDPHRSG